MVAGTHSATGNTADLQVDLRAGEGFIAGLAGQQQQVRFTTAMVVDPDMNPSPMTTFFNRTADAGAGPQQAAQQQPDAMRKFEAALKSDAQAQKPTEKLNNQMGANNTQANRQEGQQKAVAANDGRANLQALAADTARKLQAMPAESAAPAASPQGGGMGNGIMGGLARDTLIGGGLNIVMPGLGVAYAAATVARALGPNVNPEGLGTFSSATQSAPSSFRSSADLGGRKGARAVESGYSRSSEPAAAQGSSPATPAPQPQVANSRALWDKLSQGPGFGPGSDVAERADLAGANLQGVSAIRLKDMTERSVAMRNLNGMREDAKLVQDIHAAREDKGIPNTPQNMNIAMAQNLPEQKMQYATLHL